MRNLITSSADGRNWQTVLWIHGPPSTGKSTIVDLMSKLVPKESIKELSKIQTQFTGQQLVDGRLFIVNDLTNLTSQQV